MKTVARHVHPVTSLTEVVHQFMSTFHHTRLRGTEVKKAVAHFHTESFSDLQSLPLAQWTAKALHNEEVARNLTFRVTAPQVDVGPPVGIVEHLRVREIPSKVKHLEGLTQGYHRIAVGVVQRVVEVNKQILVAHINSLS